MTRWKASAIHLGISILVLGTIAALLVWRWYPPALFHMARADKLLLLMGGIDVVLGPLLTLIVYKQGKKSLRFDLATIALLQVAALGYGLHQVWVSRPVYLVAAVDRFQLVFANELDPADIANGARGFRRLPWFGAQVAAVTRSSDPTERTRALDLALAGKDIYLIPANYHPYDSAARALLERAMPARQLIDKLPAPDKATLSRAVARAGHALDNVAVAPIESARGVAAMLLNSETGAVIGPAAFDPWPAIAVLRAQPLSAGGK